MNIFNQKTFLFILTFFLPNIVFCWQGDKFYNTDKVIIIKSDIDSVNLEYYNAYIEQKVNWEKSNHPSINFIVKNETELPYENTGNHLLILGITNKFKNLSVTAPPFIITKSGFQIDTLHFNDNTNALRCYSLDWKKQYLIGNTVNALTSIDYIPIPYSQYAIIQDGTLMYHGYFNNGDIDYTRHVDIIKNRTKYFDGLMESSHFTFYYRKGTLAENNLSTIIKSNEANVNFILTKFNLKEPGFKIYYFIYNDFMEKMKYAVNGSPGHTISNSSEIHVIHPEQMESVSLHELTHLLFDKLASNPINHFFDEGIAVYSTGQWRGVELDKQINKYSNVNIKQWVMGTKGFDNAPVDDMDFPITYPIAGHFVGYLIHQYGLENFKSFNKYTKIEEASIEIYKKNINALVQEWKLNIQPK